MESEASHGSLFGPGERGHKAHYLLQLLIFGIIVVLLILMFSLMKACVKTPAERLSDRQKRLVHGLQGWEGLTARQQHIVGNLRSGVGQEDLTARQQHIVGNLRRGVGQEDLTARQQHIVGNLRRGVGQEDLTARQQHIVGNLRHGVGQEDLTARQQHIVGNLRHGVGQEGFINQLPMLGGGRLTDGAVALRAADPMSSDLSGPPSPSQKQYMKENELLEHLLYK
jgi:hypothetical protein